MRTKSCVKVQGQARDECMMGPQDIGSDDSKLSQRQDQDA